MDLSDPGSDGLTMTQDCVSTTICAESAGGSGANFPGASTTTYESGDIETMPVTITAGLDKLSAGAAATTTSGAQSTSSSSTSASVTLLSGGGESMTTMTSGSTGSSATAASTSASSMTASGDSGAVRGQAEGLGVLAAIVGFMGVLV